MKLSPCTRSSRRSSSRLGLLVRTPRSKSSTSWKRSWSAVLRSAPSRRRCSRRCCHCRRNATRRSGSRRRSRRKRPLRRCSARLKRLSQIHPVLMIVEDAHWIDPTSQELLDALVPRLPALPIMLVITYRPQPPQEYTPMLDRICPRDDHDSERPRDLTRVPSWLATSPRARRCQPTCSSRSSFAPTACRCTSRS